MTTKQCPKCDQVKPLEGGYYKAGKYHQRYCIPCHNIRRYEYKFNRKYTKRPKGYNKLPEDLRKNIEFDLYKKISMVQICKKYPILKYQNLSLWKRKGQIPTYQP